MPWPSATTGWVVRRSHRTISPTNHPSGSGARLRAGEPLDIDESRAGGNGIHHLTLETYGRRWYRTGSLNQVLRRRKL